MSDEDLSRMRDLDRAAVLAAAAVACRIRPADLERPTPCDGWDVATLLSHLSVQHRGFAAAARGEGADLAVWAPRPPAPDPVADFLAATADVLTAFGADGLADRPFRLPEISPVMAFPPIQAISFHLVDYVVHSWDLARSIGTRPELDLPTLKAAWSVTQLIPDSSREGPGAPFAPRIAAPPDAPLLDRIVAALGRDPGWKPAVPAPRLSGAWRRLHHQPADTVELVTWCDGVDS
jgi:uncharacterized protein (TIGR03086 family)